MYILFRINMDDVSLCAVPLCSQGCWATPLVCVTSSQQKHTAGQLKLHLKPGVIHKASCLKKSSDSSFHYWIITLIPMGEGDPSNMALLCLVTSTFDPELVQPGSLQGIQFQLIAAVMEGPVWYFLAPLQQVLKLKEEVCCLRTLTYMGSALLQGESVNTNEFIRPPKASLFQ